MRLAVYWLELAEDKLDDIYSYHFEKAGRKTARKLINGIILRSIDLENQPSLGPREPLLEHRKEEFRYLVYKNYKLIYWVNDKLKRIEIANLFDTRQNPTKLEETN
ncbi:MAG: type II toxin-antitoxin system RelE/ParE family toxin [Cryomorphaceae bacterium]